MLVVVEGGLGGCKQEGGCDGLGGGWGLRGLHDQVLRKYMQPLQPQPQPREICYSATGIRTSSKVENSSSLHISCRPGHQETGERCAGHQRLFSAKIESVRNRR